MRASFLTFCVVLALAIPTWAAEDFTGTTEVRLIHGDLGSPKAKIVVITDKAKIEKLVATIKLEKKVLCACDHINHAVFVKEKGDITVSLCDHCFDIGEKTYVMPPEFYKLYTAYWQEGAATQPAESPKPVDEKKAATAEVVVRGTLAADAAGPGRGGWPTYTMTVSQVFKTPKDVRIKVGQKLAMKTIKEFKGPVTLYLVFDKDQKLYRLQDPFGERGFSHVEAATARGKDEGQDQSHVVAKDVAFVFPDKQIVPDRDLPREAREARSADSNDQGAFSKVVAGRISTVTVTYSQPKVLKGKKDTENYLRLLLTIPSGSTYRHVPWAQMLGVPTVAATVGHAKGEPGTWLVWYAYPSVYCAYQDGSGKWWFGVWFHVEETPIGRNAAGPSQIRFFDGPGR